MLCIHNPIVHSLIVQYAMRDVRMLAERFQEAQEEEVRRSGAFRRVVDKLVRVSHHLL